MTPGAKTLTQRARGRSGAAAAEWALGMTDFRALIGAFARLGYHVGSLLSRAGLRPGDLDDPDARLPARAWTALIEEATRQRALPNLALRLAAEMPLGAFPLLDYVVVTSDTVGEGLKQLGRYLRIVGTPARLHVRDDEDPVRVVVNRPGSDFGVELNVAIPLFHMRRETAGRLTVSYASFSHAPRGVEEFERMFGCPVRTGASWNGFALSREACALPLRRRDPALRALLERQANHILSALPQTDDVSVRVRRALATLVAGGDTRIERVARDLGTSRRTLQRRLASAGVSYQDLLDETRREAAERYLTESSLSIAELAYLLGYSEPSAFHRAFKRWFGRSPQAFRERLRSEHVASVGDQGPGLDHGE
jgi:AraC-like DNA-binding protein